MTLILYQIYLNELKSPKALKRRLDEKRELILTSSGRPIAVISAIASPDDAEAELNSIRQARSRLALSRIRASARGSGKDRMGLEEINSVIRKARAGR